MPRPARLQPKVDPLRKVAILRAVVVERGKPRPRAWSSLAKEHDVPQRTLEGWYGHWLKQQRQYDDPTGLVDEILAIYTEVMEEASRDIAALEPGGKKVAAMRVLLDTIGRRLNLLISVGRMPTDVGDFESVGRLRTMLMRMAEIAEKHDLGTEVVEEFLSIVEDSRQGRLAEQ